MDPDGSELAPGAGIPEERLGNGEGPFPWELHNSRGRRGREKREPGKDWRPEFQGFGGGERKSGKGEKSQRFWGFRLRIPGKNWEKIPEILGFGEHGGGFKQEIPGKTGE